MIGRSLAIVTLECAGWYGFVGVLFSRAPVRRLYDRMRRWVERAAGVVMVGFGLRLVFVKD